MSFRISGLPAAHFSHLFQLPDEALREHGAVRLEAKAGSPCRITLEEAEVGEPILLLPYEHQSAGAYRSSGPIFVRQWTDEVQPLPAGDVPPSFRSRLYSVRAYDENDWMTDAEVHEGSDIEALLERFLADPKVAYLHLHHARRGCYAARVDRA